METGTKVSREITQKNGVDAFHTLGPELNLQHNNFPNPALVPLFPRKTAVLT